TTCPAPTPRRIAWTPAPLPPEHDADQPLVPYTGTDVTEARDRERLYRRMLETAHEGVWVVDALGLTLFANPRMAQILGFTLAVAAGTTISHCMETPDHPPFRPHIEHRNTAKTLTLVSPCLRKDDTRLWTLVTSSPMFDDEGRMIGVLGMVA